MSKRVALYIRVSTDGQSTDNQRQELERVAERHGWNLAAVFQDRRISGAKGRDKRAGYEPAQAWSRLAVRGPRVLALLFHFLRDVVEVNLGIAVELEPENAGQMVGFD